jgi:hypothetical protein
MTTVTISATIRTTDGREIFFSHHQANGPDANSEGKLLFSSLIHPMELVLSDAQRQFIPAPQDPMEGNAHE